MQVVGCSDAVLDQTRKMGGQGPPVKCQREVPHPGFLAGRGHAGPHCPRDGVATVCLGSGGLGAPPP
eukprot:8660371-Lingulodinium_polyedra.AAC.1